MANDTIDLFGNPSVTPRSAMMDNIAQAIGGASRAAQGDAPVSRAASLFGASFGSLLAGALMEAGVLPKPPQVVEQERLAKWRDMTRAMAEQEGVSPEKSPERFLDFAAHTALKIGAEDLALKAVQAKQLYQANRAATMSKVAQAAENMANFTPESVAAFEESGKLSDLRPTSALPLSRENSVVVYLPDGRIAGYDTRRHRVIDPATGETITDPALLRGARFSPELTQTLAESKSRGDVFGTEQAKAQVKLADVEKTAEQLFTEIQRIKADPAIKLATGGFLGRLPALFGPQARGVSRLDQLKGGIFLQAYSILRGAQAITDKEGEKAEAAFARMARAQSHKDFLDALTELEEVIRNGVAVARYQAAGGFKNLPQGTTGFAPSFPPSGAPAAAPAAQSKPAPAPKAATTYRWDPATKRLVEE